MIESLTLRHFRNFEYQSFAFSPEKTCIIGENGKGKTNILEALALPSGGVFESHLEYLVQRGNENFHVEYQSQNGKHSFSYDSRSKKRVYMLEGKSVTKVKFLSHFPKTVSFHPIGMNLLYLGPSERRDFLDNILASSFDEYKNILTQYKKVLTNRNRLLKNIAQEKSSISELSFWDNEFLRLCEEVYRYRKQIMSYLSQNVTKLAKYFGEKNENLTFTYETKVDLKNIKEDIALYIQENRQKEILLGRSLRGPHLDDFSLYVDNTPLIHYASRGEVKSIIIGLKFLEIRFIEETRQNKNILVLIDDILSELDKKHRDILWNELQDKQMIITSIEDIDLLCEKIFL